jgi:hypothetical protein
MKSPLLFTLLLLALSSCKSPFDAGGGEEIGGREVSIQYLKSLYTNRPQRITADYTIRGRVVSSDAAGNFRRTLIVEDATGGIEVKTGLLPYHETYPVGQQVRIKCAGLMLGAYGRTIRLGAESEDERYETGFIDRERMAATVIPVGTPAPVVPTLLTPENLSMRWVNCAVRVEGVRFIDEEQGSNWGDGENYVERHLQFVDFPADTLAVRTSPEAIFAADVLPAGTISAEGVLTQFAGRYSLVLNGL